MPVSVPTAAEFDALAARVTKLESGGVTPPGPTPGQPSKTGTYISKPADPPIIDDAGNVWTLVALSVTAGQQIAANGIVDPVTANVVKLGIDLVSGARRIVQQNASGNWYFTSGQPGSWSQIAGPDGYVPPPIPAGSIFHAQGGRFYAPDGSLFRPKGVNVCYRRLWGDNAVDLGRVNLAALKRAYPRGINFVRFACHGENPLPPSSDLTVRQWIADLTGSGIIVLVDLHYTGDTVGPNDQRANSWLADYATAYKGNNRVWFDTQNEPHGSGGAISAMMHGQYAAIRSTGNPNPILLCTGNPGGEISGMNPGDFADMKNAGFDTHCYGWLTAQWPQVLSDLSRFQSTDGPMPVVCAEFGDGEGSEAVSGNWVQNVQTAMAHPGGFCAWMVNWMMSPADCLWKQPLDGSAINDGYGQMVRDAIIAA